MKKIPQWLITTLAIIGGFVLIKWLLGWFGLLLPIAIIGLIAYFNRDKIKKFWDALGKE